MDEILKLAGELTRAHEKLEDEAQTVERAVRVVYRSRARRLRTLAADYAECKAALEAAVKEHPELFARPKSRQVDNVKFGWRKQKGKTVLPEDKDKLVDKLGTLLDDEEYSRCVEPVMKPIASQIAELPGKLLKRLGVTIEQDRDAPFVSITQSGAEAEVEAILSMISAEADKEAA